MKRILRNVASYSSIALIIGSFFLTRAADGIFDDPFADPFAPDSKRNTTPARKLDAKIVRALIEDSAIIVVGKVISGVSEQQKELARQYNLIVMTALGATTPFTVQIERVLSGTISTNKPITVGVIRDEVQFRSPKGIPLIFFLKKANHPPGEPYDPAITPAEWMAVSDYFGIQPHTLRLERLAYNLSREPRKTSPSSEP